MTPNLICFGAVTRWFLDPTPLTQGADGTRGGRRRTGMRKPIVTNPNYWEQGGHDKDLRALLELQASGLCEHPTDQIVTDKWGILRGRNPLTALYCLKCRMELETAT